MRAGADIEARSKALCETLSRLPGVVVLVSNEVGLGLVPETPLGRRFRDAQGRLNQAVAEAADRVVFLAAGLPLQLKGAP
jgi:adenosylcobinamide kinase/adenosylcobinamide-phosphate guanylyltransferase